MNHHHSTARTDGRTTSEVPRTARTRARAAVALLGMTGLLALTACGNGGGEAAPSPAADSASATGTAAATASGGLATATVRNTDGSEVGTVEFTEADGALMEVRARFSGMEPGYYGFHIHGTGVCEAESSAPDDPGKTGAFLSAGGHLGSAEADHPDHAGDMPSLLVTKSGDARLTFRTDRLTGGNLMDDDGSAVMVHEHTENYANVPQRYSSDGPDSDTLKTGDAGKRLACGVVESSQS